MTHPSAVMAGMKEGREARNEGRPRKSPYENIPKLRRGFHQPWLDGWDAMDAAISPHSDHRTSDSPNSTVA